MFSVTGFSETTSDSSYSPSQVPIRNTYPYLSSIFSAFSITYETLFPAGSGLSEYFQGRREYSPVEYYQLVSFYSSVVARVWVDENK